MAGLTTRQKLSVTFGVYFFLLLLLISLIFIGVFHYLFSAQTRKAVGAEANEVIRNHLLLKDDRVSITNDQAGISLSSELQENDSSALVLDQNLTLVSGFGLFQFYQSEDRETIYAIGRLARDAKNLNKTAEENIPRRGVNLLVMAVPLSHQGKFLGVLILARPLSQIEAADNLILLTLTGLSILGLLGSVVLGRKLADQVMMPVKQMAGVIEKIDLDKLDRQLEYTGHRDDELTMLTEKFNGMLLRLKTMSEQQREFISNASHELRTPLTRVITSLEVIAAKTDRVTERELDKVTGDLFSLNDLLSDLLTLSRISRQNLGPVKPVAVADVMEEVIGKLRPEMQRKEIYPEISHLENGEVMLPREYLALVLTNLLGNAVKYSPNKGVIRITGADMKKYFRLTVADSGIGISENEIQKIFDRFYRSTEARSRGTGLGLGLPIVKRICDLYDINIEVTSQKGTGSTFTLLFPTS